MGNFGQVKLLPAFTNDCANVLLNTVGLGNNWICQLQTGNIFEKKIYSLFLTCSADPTTNSETTNPEFSIVFWPITARFTSLVYLLLLFSWTVDKFMKTQDW